MKKAHNNNNSREISTEAPDKADGCEAIAKANMAVDLGVKTVDDVKSYSDQMKLLTSYKMVKLETDGSSAWHCLLCGKDYVNRGRCSRHIQSHLVGLALPCAHCDKVFGSKIALCKHQRVCQRKTISISDFIEVLVIENEQEEEG